GGLLDQSHKVAVLRDGQEASPMDNPMPSLPQRPPPVLRKRQPRNPLQQDRLIGHLVAVHFLNEHPAFLPACHQFGIPRVFVLDSDETLAPPRGQCRGVLPDTLRVVAEGLVKGRTLANRAIDQIRILGIAEREPIRLAADYHDFVRAGDCAGGADQVLQFMPLHGTV
ncbi:MAG: hypothetical protein MUF86_15190, partial [Akkermansiaceae bacterium]|nr:hypothetical protein [Akkermansiaceae bacterium]